MDNKDIIKLSELGYNSKEISKKLNIDKLNVDLELLKIYYNVKSKIPIETYIHIIKNRYKGISISESSRKFNTSCSLVSKVLKKCHIHFDNIRYFNKDLLTNDVITDIVNGFNSGIPVYKLVDTYGFNKDILANIINSNGSKTCECSFNEYYFDNIDNEYKSY
jgi:hypothetical protein